MHWLEDGTRTVDEKAVTMLYDSKLPKELRFQTVKTTTYFLNRGPTQALGLKKTPTELWYGTKPNISKLRIFGCTAYAQIPKELRKKLDDPEEKCAIVGYQDSGWLLRREDWKKLHYSRDVVRFVEREMYMDKSQTSVQAIAIPVEKEESVITFIDEDVCRLNFATLESLVDEEKIKSSGKYEEAIRKEINALIWNRMW